MQIIRCIEINNISEAKKELAAIGCDPWGIEHMADKAVFRVLKLKNITFTQANIIKQEMLSCGGEAAVTRGVVNHSVEQTDILLMATEAQYRRVCNKLKIQPFKLKPLAEKIEQTLDNLMPVEPRIIDCRGKTIELGKGTLVMGILNITPDSFSDGGKFDTVDNALRHALRLVEEGADIIDVGGESTRPGHQPVSVEEELKRVIPVLERLVKEVDVPISVDTSKAEVARQSLEAGAHIINDVWAGQADPEMFAVVADYDAPVVLMHNQNSTEYGELMSDIVHFLEQAADQAVKAGIPGEKIIVDPGIGFGKNYEQNLEVMARLQELKSLGYPVLLGTSRKSMIGNTLDLPVDQRVEGTAATIAFGITKGVDIVRVHDVKEMVRVCRMTDAMVRGKLYG
ncbi:dihydropteroate synthase [Desulfohalotomaculum tongense]|uniref:dihydropteroate synthase n=1 Tax=Desulforadius tongensis TaxID=1216062 RepID=UPI001958A055|nr:dihydropteroate synthase [Desulforadius tongensis]MBM7856025.1 dihydropteroate synthase [Desulforadius tongensis]